MKILFITSAFFPHIGGVEKHVFEITRELLRREYKVDIITEEKVDNSNRLYQTNHLSDTEAINIKEAIKSSYIDTFYGENVRIFFLNFGKKGRFKKFRIWKALWKNRELVKNADIVHCHDVFIWYLPFRFMYFWKPVFTTFHGYETQFPPKRKAIIIRKISEWFSKGNICIGDYLKKWYGVKPDYVLYGGVDKTQNSFFKSNICCANKLKTQNYSSKIKILFIGRLEKDTGVKLYLETLNILKKRGFNFEFEAYGDGSLKTEVEMFGKVNGFVDDLSKRVADASFVFSSSYLSILEALNYKKVVFSVFDNPLKKDYLKNTPFSKYLIISDSSEEIAKKIMFLIGNKKFEKHMVEVAYDWVKNQSWNKVVDTYIKLWKI